MKRFIVAFIIIICAASGACAVLQLTGTVDFASVFDKDDETAEAAFYVSFMDGYFLIDSDGVVISSTSDEPDGIPEIQNMRFNSFIVGQAADAASKSTLEYVKDVCALLEAYSLSVSCVEVSDEGTITLSLDGVYSIVLGENEDTDIKIKDLNSLYSSLLVYDGGILYMTSADTNGQGYTFKEISDEDENETSGESDDEDAAEEAQEDSAET